MAAPGQEEDGDQDAVDEKKIINRTFLSLSQITALSEQNVEGVQKYNYKQTELNIESAIYFLILLFYSAIYSRKLEEFLNFKELKTSLKEAILLDYYTAGFWWAKERNFSVIQLSGFMDLLHFLLENLSDKHMTLGDNLKELGKAMAGIGETDSKRSGDLNFFSIEQAKAVIDYLNISLFKHYKLYEYLFHSTREELVISNEYVIELAQPSVPPFPALLEDGIPSDIYSSFVISPTAAERESKGSDQEGYLGEPCPEVESFEANAVAGVTAEDQKSAVGEIPSEIIGNLEEESNCMAKFRMGMVGMKTRDMKIPRAEEKTELKQCLSILSPPCPYSKQRWEGRADRYASVNTQAELHQGIFTTAPEREVSSDLLSIQLSTRSSTMTFTLRMAQHKLVSPAGQEQGRELE
ncbi:at-rich interactive domain-containing protein 5b [Limosa lapponica baueri]|uniref:At-rich interactive domain-containing protein 5b n=1 Tax=Limosa lapponica baueri TaxID=1758121 RepID=A0A2I0TVG3_LIMLA|nr:at-rich interactive domain-containing protein 5b [Limosa lapponica baueri]